jgi:hypothetical protein
VPNPERKLLTGQPISERDDPKRGGLGSRALPGRDWQAPRARLDDKLAGPRVE